MTPFDLDGKTILVTGASSGLGRQCAISCAQMGASVILVARNEQRLKETFESMDHKERHLYYMVDLVDYERVDEMVKKMASKELKIDGLVNCAGTSSTFPMKLVSIRKLEEMFHINVFAAYNLTRLIARKAMISNAGLSVIFFSSIMGITGESGKSLYSMTKGALISGTRSLAIELAKKNIRVNTLSPGAVVTPINEHAHHMQDAKVREQLEQSHPLGLGTPEDIAHACVYLLSDASKWVTGTNLIVDGGYTAK